MTEAAARYLRRLAAVPAPTIPRDREPVPAPSVLELEAALRWAREHDAPAVALEELEALLHAARVLEARR